MEEAIITKKGHLYTLEYKEDGQNKVIISPIVFDLIEEVNGKVNSLLIRF